MMRRPYAVALSLLVVCLCLGRAAAQSAFTIAVAPDLQQEVLRDDDSRLADRFRWLVEHREELNLQCLLQVGDFLNWDTAAHDQYERATMAVKVLDEAALPYVFCLGNHDTFATGGTPEKPGGSARPGNVRDNLRNTATFNQYFPLSRFRLLGGVFEPDKIDNAWHTFQAGGLDWLVLNLELWPRAEAIAWARTVVESHPSYNVIVLTHSFLSPGPDGPRIEQRNGGYGDNSPQYLFDQVIKPYANVRMVLSGHAGSHGYRADLGEQGQTIHEFVQCYHDGEANPVRLLTIDPVAGTITSRVHCPATGQDKADGSSFTIQGVNWVPAGPR